MNAATQPVEQPPVQETGARMPEKREMPLGDVWEQMKANAVKEQEGFIAETQAAVTKIETCYDAPFAPDEQRAIMGIAEKSNVITVDFTKKAEGVVSGTIETKAAAPPPVTSGPKVEIDPAYRREARIAEIRAMRFADLKAAGERLFDETIADLKAHPEKLKPYKEALKTGIPPNDSEADDAEINLVFREIQARWRSGRLEPSSAAEGATPPPPAETAPAAMTGVAAYGHSFDKDFAEIARMSKAGDKEGIAAYAKQLQEVIDEADKNPPEVFVRAAAEYGLIPLAEAEAAVAEGRAEEYKTEGMENVRGLLARAKAELPQADLGEAVAERPAATHDVRAEETTPAPDATQDAGKAPAAEATPAPKPSEKRVVEQPTDAEVIGKLDAYFKKAKKRMPEATREDIARSASRKAAEAGLRQLRDDRARLSDGAAFERELKERIKLTDDEIEALTDDDLEDIRTGLGKLYDEAIRISEEEIGKRAAAAEAGAAVETSPPAPLQAEKPAVAAPEAVAGFPQLDAETIAARYLKMAEEPIKRRALLKRLRPGKISANAFLKELADLAVVSADDAKRMLENGPAVADLLRRVSDVLAKRAANEKS